MLHLIYVTVSSTFFRLVVYEALPGNMFPLLSIIHQDI